VSQDGTNYTCKLVNFTQHVQNKRTIQHTCILHILTKNTYLTRIQTSYIFISTFYVCIIRVTTVTDAIAQGLL